ncbi:DUF2336 domain-containing protein [Hansschlegelia quercus]|uniref:DUF2336 domain-containing protein n=1 Tax=Hansschlegelia quercus TaxID=2528245 RepID=A0A4Q9GHL3_9HYPH|nr:DUF2336 domain-containing protein [Hansschlegelia quercus]TBN48638.1 DUF2336 domain-containing protein [Hansschlegelia quercus]
MSEDLLPVETLESLSRQEGVDVRPILLRVLTDLFIQKAHHAPEEIVRYEELTLQLLDVVDAETREIVATKLAGDMRTPPSIIERLLSDMISVSAPVIARYPGLSRKTAMNIALDGSTAAVVAVASRPDIDADLSRILASHDEDIVAETLVANPAAALGETTLPALVTRSLRSPTLAVALLGREDIDYAALAPLYLHAVRERRAAIREALGARHRAGVSRSHDFVDASAVEIAAASGSGKAVADALAEALGLRPADAGWLATEPSGEAFVMLLRAAGLQSEAIARAILVCQPEIARSVPRFFDLVEIAEATPRAVAADIVAALVGAEAPAVTTPRHQPLFEPMGVKERGGAARAVNRTRRVFAKPNEGQQRS